MSGDPREQNPGAASDVTHEPIIARSAACAQCSAEGCERPRYVRGWCSKHYQRWLAHGDPEYVRSKHPEMTLAEVLTEMNDAYAELKAHVERDES